MQQGAENALWCVFRRARLFIRLDNLIPRLLGHQRKGREDWNSIHASPLRDCAVRRRRRNCLAEWGWRSGCFGEVFLGARAVERLFFSAFAFGGHLLPHWLHRSCSFRLEALELLIDLGLSTMKGDLEPGSFA